MSLKDNLIGVWCEAAAPTTDEFTNNLTLTDHNTVGTASGQVGTAGDFEASSSQYLSRASESLLQTGDIDFTVACWVNMESIIGNYFTIAAKDNIGTAREWILISDQDFSNKFNWAVFDGGTTLRGTVQWGTVPSASTWYHLVAWHDSVNNEVGICVNAGTPVTSATSGAVGTNSEDFQIGATKIGGTPNLPFDGLINQLAFWKRVLTSQERTDLYNGGSGLAFASWDASGSTIIPHDIQHSPQHQVLMAM